MPVRIKGSAKNINIDQSMKNPKKDEILHVVLQIGLSRWDRPSKFKDARIAITSKNI